MLQSSYLSPKKATTKRRTNNIGTPKTRNLEPKNRRTQKMAMGNNKGKGKPPGEAWLVSKVADESPHSPCTLGPNSQSVLPCNNILYKIYYKYYIDILLY